MRSSVDLPQPEGPTTVTNSPRRTENEMSSSAWVPSGNTIERCSNFRAASLRSIVAVVLDSCGLVDTFERFSLETTPVGSPLSTLRRL